MAMTKCKECGTEVSTKAQSCPKCGAAKPKPAGCFTVIAATVFLLFSASYLMNSLTTGSADFATPAAIVPLPPDAPAPDGWSYQTNQDEMTSKPIRSAIVLSKNQFELEFPYGNPQRGMLEVRQHPRWGLDVLVRIERGQIDCNSIEPCRMQVRFDDAAPQAWTFAEPEDRSTEILFVRDSEAFLRKLRASKTITIELKFFRTAPQPITFATADLKWE